MSVEAISWAWQQTTRSSGQRLVLLALCDHMAHHDDTDGLTAWPSVKRLAAMTGIGSSMVREHLGTLVDDGLIEKVQRRRRASGTLGTWLYRIDPTSAGPPAVADPTSAGPPAVESAGPPAVDQRRPTGAHEPLVLNPKDEPRLASARRLCDRFADNIADGGAKRPTVTKAWVADMDKMLRLDGRDEGDVERVLDWLAFGRDEVAAFWRPNVMSPRKLRAKWDQMRAQALRERQRRQAGRGGSTLERVRTANQNLDSMSSGG